MLPTGKTNGQVSGWLTETMMIWNKFPDQMNVVNLSKRNLDELPKELFRMHRIESLNITFNNLQEIPKEIKALSGIRTIHFGHNLIKLIPEEFSLLVHLEHLHLNNNQIQVLPDSLFTLKKLSELDLSGNQIVILPENIKNLNLERLNVSNNQLVEIPIGLYHMENLKELNFSTNQIRSIDSSLFHLKNLRKFNIQSNLIEDLPNELGFLVQLEDLNIKDNPLKNEEIIKRANTNSIITYFRNQLRYHSDNKLENRKLLFNEVECERNINYSEDPPLLLSANPEKLVSYLTQVSGLTAASYSPSHNNFLFVKSLIVFYIEMNEDLQAMNIVKTCFSYFINPEEFLELFMIRYSSIPCSPLPTQQDENASSRHFTSAHLEFSNEFLSSLKQFIKTIKPQIARQIISTLSQDESIPLCFFDSSSHSEIEKLRKKLKKQLEKEEKKKNDELLKKIEKEIKLQKKARKSLRDRLTDSGGSVSNHVLSFSAQDLANQICKMNSEKFSAIPRSEFLHQTWSKHPENAPKIIECINSFNMITNWASSLIVNEGDLKTRLKTYQHLLDVAAELLELGDFCGVFSLASAFSSAAISRLKKTENLLDEKHKGILAYLNSIVDNSRNYKNYQKAREMHIQKSGRCVPALVIYLKQLTFAEDGNSTLVEDSDLINFEKFRTITKILEEIGNMQHIGYEFTLNDNTIIKGFLSLQKNILDEKEQYINSLLCEKSTRKIISNSSADIPHMHATRQRSKSCAQELDF